MVKNSNKESNIKFKLLLLIDFMFNTPKSDKNKQNQKTLITTPTSTSIPTYEQDYKECVRMLSDFLSEKGIEKCIALLEINPKDRRLHYSLGVGYMQRGMYNDAVDSFSEAIKIDQHYQKAYLMRAVAYRQLNRYKSASSDLEAIKTWPEFELVITELKYKKLFGLSQKDDVINIVQTFVKNATELGLEVELSKL